MRPRERYVLVTEDDKPEPEAIEPLLRLSDILLRKYTLRELLWCGSCDTAWVPVLLQPMSRYYVCTKKACSHPAMPARVMEYRVWSRFIRARGTVPQGVPKERRHEVLKQELRRVEVREGLVLRFEWRD
jgi:hypothetical protein